MASCTHGLIHTVDGSTSLANSDQTPYDVAFDPANLSISSSPPHFPPCPSIRGYPSSNDQAGFLTFVSGLLGRLSEEVKNVEALGDLLRDIGCFDPPPSPVTPSPIETLQYPSTDPLAQDVAVVKVEGGRTVQIFGEEKHRGSRGVVDDPRPNEEGPELVGIASPDKTSEPAGTSVDDSTEKRTSNGDEERIDTTSVASFSFRSAESQRQEAVEGLRFHLSALYRAVDLANSNMRDARQDFGVLLHKVQR